ncbi:hypothetical protein Q5752_004032 [Cryptotrichosporon argae]
MPKAAPARTTHASSSSRSTKSDSSTAPPPLTTPDGRYIVVKGALWRATNPSLPEAERQALVDALMTARRDVGVRMRANAGEAEVREARSRVDAAKRALGERGPVWWTDGASDWNRKQAKNTPYADWYAGAQGEQAEVEGKGAAEGDEVASAATAQDAPRRSTRASKQT